MRRDAETHTDTHTHTHTHTYIHSQSEVAEPRWREIANRHTNTHTRTIASQWVEWLWNRRVEHWVIRSSARLFARTTHSYTCSLARSAALSRSIPSLRLRDFCLWNECVDFIQFQSIDNSALGLISRESGAAMTKNSEKDTIYTVKPRLSVFEGIINIFAFKQGYLIGGIF